MNKIKEFLVSHFPNILWAGHFLFLRVQIRGQGSGWDLLCIYRGWRKWIPQIRHNGIPEMWRWLWWWGKPGCLEGEIGIYLTLLSYWGHTNTHKHTHTQFDREARRKFHLHKLPQLVKVLERGDDLEHIQQPGRGETIHESAVFFCHACRSFSCSIFPLSGMSLALKTPLRLPGSAKYSWIVGIGIKIQMFV